MSEVQGRLFCWGLWTWPGIDSGLSWACTSGITGGRQADLCSTTRLVASKQASKQATCYCSECVGMESQLGIVGRTLPKRGGHTNK